MCGECHEAICAFHLGAVFEFAQGQPLLCDSVRFCSSVGDMDGRVHYNYNGRPSGSGEVEILSCAAHEHFVASSGFLLTRWQSLLEDINTHVATQEILTKIIHDIDEQQLDT